MSTQETYKGTLTPVDLDGLTVAQKIQEILGTTELPFLTETWVEALEEGENDYFYDANAEVLYHLHKVELDEEDFISMESHDDGSYSFVTSFYNGGTQLSEMLQEGLS